MKRRQREPGRHDWLGLVALSGLVVTEPVLEEQFPEGPPPVDRPELRWFRTQADRYRLARADYDARRARGEEPRQAEATIRRFIDFVLDGFLQHPGDYWRAAGEVPESCRRTVPTLEQELRPTRVLLHNDNPALLVDIVEPGQEIDRKDPKAGRWKVSPAARMDRLLRETGHPLGLVTNGEEWRLLHCPPGLTTGSIGWTTRLLYEEPSAIAAFHALLGKDLLRPAKSGAPTLADLCKRSLDRQVEVADQLGIQVREGSECLLLALDQADRESGGALLAEMDDERVYEMLLVVMMRLLFLLYAEERALLPHGQVLYDHGYGLTWLWHELQRRQETANHDYDAWERLLATFRLVHEGCEHPDLSLKAYGGLLFDPRRYPVLEEKACRISNRTVRDVLDKLLFAKQGRGGGRQRVGYWSLDVEEIGYLYEGLLDHRAARAGDSPMVKLRGGGEAALAITGLESRTGAELIDFILEQTDRKTTEPERKKARALLEAEASEDDLRCLAEFPPEVAARARPYGSVIQCRELTPPGWRYLTTGTSRRASGAHYTPQFLTERIVRTTLEPLVYRCEEGKPGAYVLRDGQKVLREPRELLALKICDMAAGSGAFLVQVIRYLADRLVEAWDRAALAAGEGVPLTLPFAEASQDPTRDLLLPFDNRDELRLWARRQVASRCVYGVDKNPLAVEMAKLSLWLVTLGRDMPFTFLDHAIKCGDSLVGVNREQLEAWSLETDGRAVQLPIGFGSVEHALLEAAEARREVERLPVLEAADAEKKAAILARAEQTTESLRLAGDLIVAPAFIDAKPAQRKAEGRRLLETFSGIGGAAAAVREGEAGCDGGMERLRGRAKGMLRGLKPFHWFLEFPEVFEGGGFDAFVGNPPFLGGKRITTILGVPYRDYLVGTIAGGQRGSADLVSYFFLRANDLQRAGGTFGLLATNTIAQGDTREVGLDQLLARGGEIIGAVKSMPWPGVASLEVSVVHLHKGAWQGDRALGEQGGRRSRRRSMRGCGESLID